MNLKAIFKSNLLESNLLERLHQTPALSLIKELSKVDFALFGSTFLKVDFALVWLYLFKRWILHCFGSTFF